MALGDGIGLSGDHVPATTSYFQRSVRPVGPASDPPYRNAAWATGSYENPAPNRTWGPTTPVTFVQLFVAVLYVHVSFRYTPALDSPPNISTSPWSASNAIEAPVRGRGETMGDMLSQLNWGLILSWIAAAAPVPTTSVSVAVPPAKSVSEVHVCDVAEVGPARSRNSPAVESNAIASTTESRLIPLVPLRSAAPPPTESVPEQKEG